jgi:hypothetical protein
MSSIIWRLRRRSRIVVVHTMVPEETVTKESDSFESDYYLYIHSLVLSF